MYVAPLVGKARAAVQLCDARLCIFEGSVRSGKTIASLLAWLRFVREGPAGNLLMVGKTERTLKRNIIDPLVDMLGKSRAKFVAGSGELWLLGRRIYVAGANDERSLDKIRGLTLAGTYCDELATMPESFFTMLLTRLSLPGSRLYGTSNPEGPAHWLKKKYLDRAGVHLDREGELHRFDGDDRLDLNRFSFQLSDNPSLTAEYVAALNQEFTGLWHRRLVRGEWCLAEGTIFDMWDPSRHVVALVPRIWKWVAVGVDYGTTNPFAALLVGLVPDGTLYVVSEFRYESRKERRSLTDVEYSARLRAWLDSYRPPGATVDGVRPESLVVDPSAASFIQQLWRDGWSPTAADNDVTDGIRTMSSLLSAGKLKVHKSCRGFIEEMASYSWDPKKAQHGVDAPMKVDDHSIDAVRYAVRTTEHSWRRPALMARRSAGARADAEDIAFGGATPVDFSSVGL